MAQAEALKVIFEELDTDARQLLTLIHEIRIDLMVEKDPHEKVEKALFLAERVFANLYRIYG